jgi:hypothetical protein
MGAEVETRGTRYTNRLVTRATGNPLSLAGSAVEPSIARHAGDRIIAHLRRAQDTHG